MDDTAVIDQPTEDLDLVDQPLDESQPEPEDVADKQQPEDKIDGRRFNPEWSKALKELRELYPDRADMLTKLRDTYGRYGALTEIAPKGLDDVKQWKATIDAVGGPEAAAEMMQRVASMEEIDSKIEAADDSFVDELPENLQKGVYGMVPQLLNRLAEKDKDAFSAAVQPHFQSALASTGLGDVLKEMYTAAGDNEAVKSLIQKTYAWYQQQTSGAGAMPQGTKSADPQVQRLQAELETRRQSDDNAFVQSVTDSTNKYVAEAFSKTAEVYLKQLNLTEAQKSDLMESFGAKLADKLGSDQAFNKQLAAYKSLKNRNPETVNSYIHSKVDENAKSIIDGLVTARYGGMRQKPKPAVTTNGTTDNGATRVAKIPDPSEWDMAKMDMFGYEATAKIGKFFLKGGRTVQVVRPN